MTIQEHILEDRENIKNLQKENRRIRKEIETLQAMLKVNEYTINYTKEHIKKFENNGINE